MITIKFNRRLLATAVAGLALVLCAVLVVSLNGDDKPAITTNPPAEEEPQDAQVNPTTDAETLTPPPEDQDDPELPDDDETGPGDNGEGDPVCNGKAHGLQTAVNAHIEAMEMMMVKGQTTPGGLHHSLNLLTEVYAGAVAGEKVNENANRHNK